MELQGGIKVLKTKSLKRDAAVEEFNNNYIIELNLALETNHLDDDHTKSSPSESNKMGTTIRNVSIPHLRKEKRPARLLPNHILK